MEKVCERCGASPRGYELLDYCAVCSSDLCPHCMAEGCCGNVPAESGTEADNNEESVAVEHRLHWTGGDASAEQQRIENERAEWGNPSRRPASQ